MEETEGKNKQFSIFAIIQALAFALMSGALLFVLMFEGIIFPKPPKQAEAVETKGETSDIELSSVEFLVLEPLLVSLGGFSSGQNLRFEGYLEIETGASDEIQHLMPRIMDVLNTYLRAIDQNKIQESNALLELRLQMLRRVQIVVGENLVKDLLISKFVLS